MIQSRFCQSTLFQKDSLDFCRFASETVRTVHLLQRGNIRRFGSKWSSFVISQNATISDIKMNERLRALETRLSFLGLAKRSDDLRWFDCRTCMIGTLVVHFSSEIWSQQKIDGRFRQVMWSSLYMASSYLHVYDLGVRSFGTWTHVVTSSNQPNRWSSVIWRCGRRSFPTKDLKALQALLAALVWMKRFRFSIHLLTFFFF